MYCKKCGNQLSESSKTCPNCGVVIDSKNSSSIPIDIKDFVKKGSSNLSLILIVLEIAGFVISLFSSTFGGGIVILSMIVSIVHSMPNYKATRSSKGFKSYVEYISTGVTGKNPKANRLDCLSVALGIGIYILSLVFYAILSGQRADDLYYYEVWTFWP